MKKVVTILTSVLLLIICIFSLTACSKVPTDYKDARTNLRKNGYSVTVSSNSEEAAELAYYALHTAVFSLDDPSAINAGYSLLESFEEDFSDLIRDIDTCLVGISEEGDGEDMVLIVYFDDAKALSTNYDIFVSIFDLIMNNSFDSDIFLTDTKDLSYGKSKNVLYIGTKQAFKDSKK